jgi:hypothetical protein
MALPIWNFILPIYSFWHFDDFTWGETRKVNGGDKSDKDSRLREEEEDKKFVLGDNASSLQRKLWHIWEKERLNALTKVKAKRVIPIVANSTAAFQPNNRNIIISPPISQPPSVISMHQQQQLSYNNNHVFYPSQIHNNIPPQQFIQHHIPPILRTHQPNINMSPQAFYQQQQQQQFIERQRLYVQQQNNNNDGLYYNNNNNNNNRFY